MTRLIQLIAVVVLMGVVYAWGHRVTDTLPNNFGVIHRAHTHEPLTYNQKYRVVWHEFVALTVNHQWTTDPRCDSTDVWYGHKIAYYGAHFRPDTIRCDPVLSCDTIGFRPTVVEYILIEGSSNYSISDEFLEGVE